MLTASFNLYMTRPISEGEMKATGRVVYGSRRFFVAEAVAVNSDGQEVARGSGTFMPSSISLTPEVGYE
jgi:acyl-coenzyme A thioesterase PaaI-like protein